MFGFFGLHGYIIKAVGSTCRHIDNMEHLSHIAIAAVFFRHYSLSKSASQRPQYMYVQAY